MANLLDQASIVLTPTAYDDGKVLCAKPSEPPYGDFDFSRNSAATRVNAQGLVENVQALSGNLVQNGDFSEEGVQEVSNGSFSQEGAELVTNGDFATDSGWQLTQATISNGEATFATTDGSFAGIRQNVFTIGKTYLISIEVSNLVGTAEVNTNGGTSIGLDITSVGTKSFYMVAENTDIEIKRKFGVTNVSATIDNVSVREVGQDWTLQPSWGIAENKATSNGSGLIYQTSVSYIDGKTYKVTFDADITSGSGTVRLGNTTAPTAFANGSNEFYLQTDASNTTRYIFFNGTSLVGSITNISVKEVGQNWILNTNNNNQWSIAEGQKASYAATATDFIITSNVLTIGRKYRASLDILDTGGSTIRLSVNSQAGGSFFNYSLGDSGYTTEFIATTNYLRIGGSSSGASFSVDNISVIEITDDTNLPRINYEGFSYQDALGSEEIVNGGFDDGITGWSTSGSTPATVLNGIATIPNTSYIFQNALADGKQGKIVVSGNGSVRYRLGTNLSYSVQTAMPFTIYGTFGQNARIQIQNSSGTDITIDDVSVKEYLGQEVVPDSGCGSWLFEPQTTQLLTYSEDFSQWIPGGDTTIESGYLAPDGTNNAYKASGAGGAIVLGASLLTTTTRSIYARTVSGTGQAHLCSFNGNSNNLFTITEEWQRFEVNSAITTGAVNFYAVDFRGGTTLSEVILWGANATNDQDYATSYIPSNGSQVTRNQDVCTNGGSLASINSTEGVLYFEGSTLVNGGQNRYISLSNNTSSNRLQIIFHNNSNRLSIGMANPIGSVSSLNDFSFVQTNNNKIAVSYSALGLKLFVNGILKDSNTDNASFTPNTLTTLDFALWNQTSALFEGKTKCVAVWKEALSDEELTELTTI